MPEAKRTDTNQFDSGDEKEKQEQRPVPVNIFDASLKHVRWEVAWKWLVTTLVLMTFILACMSIYWGSLFHATKNLRSLNIAIVDFDGQVAPYDNDGITPFFGPAIVKMAQEKLDSGKPTLGYWPLPPSKFNNDPIQVRQAVYDFHYWGAIIINPNATAAATYAAGSGDSSYDPTGAAQIIFVESRDDTAWDGFIWPALSDFLFDAQTQIGGQWAKKILQESTTNSTLRNNMVNAPTALSPGLAFAHFNLRPFYPYTMTPTVTVGLIYLIIISFFSFGFYLPVYSKLIKPQGHPPLKFWQMIVIRYFGIQGAYLGLSLAYSLVSLAFQIDFSTPNPITSDTMVTLTTDGYTNAPRFGGATFVAFWVLNWLGMMALGFACENVAMIVGTPWVGLWLIFWVISNVSTSFYPIDITPHFYYYGYAFPLHNVVEATRCLLFDLHNTLGLNYGILIAWAAVNTALFPICCKFMKYKNLHHVKEYWS